MKKIMKYSYILALGAAMAAGLQSCATEEPFNATGEGDLRIRAKVSSALTRAITDESTDINSLSEKCVVYISSEKGLIRKYEGLHNVPDKITLKTGHYVAEAWTGDSVTASFDKKFYRGYQPFDMQAGDNEVTVTCKIANVVVSVNENSLNVGLKHLNVKVWNTRGDLSFTEDNIDKKGYFMMPNSDTDLNYLVEGEDLSGKLISKEGKIENVQRAYEYVLSLRAEGAEPIWGGTYFDVVIEKIPVVEEVIEIYGRPAVSGVGFSLDSQVTGAQGAFDEKIVYVRGFYGIDRLTMKAIANEEQLAPIFSEVGLLNCEESVKTRLNNAGIRWDVKDCMDEARELPYTEYYITFGKDFLNSLPVADSEYAIEISATDGQGKENKATLRIANTAGAVVVEDPVVLEDVATSNDLMAVTTTQANVNVTIYDSAVAPMFQYREVGTADWNEVSLTDASGMRTRATSVVKNVKLSGLKAATKYEYRVVDGEFTSDLYSFTTEGMFSLINSSFEDWSTYKEKTLLGTKTVTLPGDTGDKTTSFWGSGNEGSATANMTLTDKSTDMVSSGTYSARLESKSAMNILAAGNLFVGEYVKTDGTNGVLSLGRSFDGTHPQSVKVMVNYRPGNDVSVKSGNESYLPANFGSGNDHGQIYIALTTSPVEIRTNPSNRKLFDPTGSEVLAYGEYTFTGNYGPDGQLQSLEIPFAYNEKAKTNKPLYIVIVVSASKYGDYFSGSVGSLMYLDDFELVY